MTLAVANFLSGIEIGPPTVFERVVVWPLLPGSGPGSERRSPFYRPLGEALVRGEVVVEEISSSGSVPNVRVRSLCDEALLVLFGEELRGAKQNRIANASFLIPPRGEVVIDVSCVEAGRWASHARPGAAGAAPRFEGVGSVVSQTMRRRMSPRVTESLAFGHGFRADQGEVWAEVGDRLSRSSTRSDSSAWSDHFAARSERLSKARERFAPSGLGFVAAIDGEVVGMELIGDPAVYAASFPRLIDAYLIDALDEADSAAAATAKTPDPLAFVAAVRAAQATSGPSLGLGEDLRLRSDAVEGSALVAGEVVHLTAAPRSDESSRPRRRSELSWPLDDLDLVRDVPRGQRRA